MFLKFIEVIDLYTCNRYFYSHRDLFALTNQISLQISIFYRFSLLQKLINLKNKNNQRRKNHWQEKEETNGQLPITIGHTKGYLKAHV